MWHRARHTADVQDVAVLPFPRFQGQKTPMGRRGKELVRRAAWGRVAQRKYTEHSLAHSVSRNWWSFMRCYESRDDPVGAE